jgi:xylose dehydrogenase (NAD/NADP)
MINKQMLRWGILGTGTIAGKFAEDLHQSHPGHLVAVGSRNSERAIEFGAPYSVPNTVLYEEVLADPSVDAIYIALPNGMHHQWSIAAMKAGKHVLCEKPIASNHREAEEMFAVSKETGMTLIEAFMYRTHPAIIHLIEQVRSGDIGEIRLIRSNFSFSRSIDTNDARYQPGQAGGSLMDVGCYCVNFCRALLNLNPSEVAAMAHIHETGVDDYAAGLLRFGDSTLATFTCGMTVKNDWSTFIAGTKGQIRIDNPWFSDGKYCITRNQGIERKEFKSEIGAYSREAIAFSDAVNGTAEPWIPEAESLGNIHTLDQLRNAADIIFPI